MLQPKDATWLAETFRVGHAAWLAGPVDRGEQGVVWQLTTSTGRYAVKETLLPLPEEQAVSAYRFQLRAEAYGVVAPRQLLAHDGRVTVCDRGEPLRLYDWVDLRRPDRDMDPHAVGRLLAGMHLAGAPQGGAGDGWYVGASDVDPWFVEPVGRAGWESLLTRLKSAGARFAEGVARLVEDLVAVESIMRRPALDGGVCHRDLWADNVRALVLDRRPVVIDWDNLGPASVNQELAMVLVEFGTTADRVRSLYRSYLHSGGLGRITSTADFTMPVAVLNHILELGCRQWLEATTDEQHEHAALRVAEFVGDPLTLPVVERFLAQALSS